MKLAYCKPATAAPDNKPQTRTDGRLYLERCRADVAHQPPRVARRLDRLLRSFAKTLEPLAKSPERTEFFWRSAVSACAGQAGAGLELATRSI